MHRHIPAEPGEESNSMVKQVCKAGPMAGQVLLYSFRSEFQEQFAKNSGAILLTFLTVLSHLLAGAGSCTKGIGSNMISFHHFRDL